MKYPPTHKLSHVYRFQHTRGRAFFVCAHIQALEQAIHFGSGFISNIGGDFDKEDH